MKKHLPAVLTGIGLLILWQVIAMCINAAYILPSPTQIAVKIWELREPLFTVHTPATMLVTLIGLLISVVLGVGLAVVMERFECVERALYPVIVTTQTIPVTAIAPLFVLWLGYGIWSKVLVAVLITFFPITISVHDGLKSAKRENEELLRTMGMSDTAIFFKLKFPAALPSFFAPHLFPRKAAAGGKAPDFTANENLLFPRAAAVLAAVFSRRFEKVGHVLV